MIITGANSGIGYYSALDFAKRGATVILACRSEEKAKIARDSIIKATGNPNISYKLVDLNSFKSVRAFCKDVNATVDKIDVLLNNAGMGGTVDTRTEDGNNDTWQTNYFSMFLLTVLLAEKLKKSSSRVVIVCSAMALLSNVKLDTLNKFSNSFVPGFPHWAYSWTKQCNILFGRELARRMKGSNVNVYLANPGPAKSGIFQHASPMLKPLAAMVMGFLYKSTEEGAQTLIYCSVAKEIENETGHLYDECQKITMYRSCRNTSLDEAIWEKTAEIVKLQPHERI